MTSADVTDADVTDADVIVVGAGLAGLVATAELIDAGKSVIVVEQESPHNFGGQAFWSFGGIFLVDSLEQRRMGIKDNVDLAWQDWEGTAGFDREVDDHWGQQWARAYVDFAAGERSAAGSANAACGSSPSSDGPSVATAGPWAMATPCRASTSRGAPGPVSSSRSCARSVPVWPMARSSWPSGIRSTR